MYICLNFWGLDHQIAWKASALPYQISFPEWLKYYRISIKDIVTAMIEPRKLYPYNLHGHTKNRPVLFIDDFIDHGCLL